MTFAELGLSEQLLRAVQGEGYEIPTPIQALAIPDVLTGRDLLGCAQTGTGKTAAFALPILHRLTQAGNPPRGGGRKTRVLVLASTRELATQIAESFQTYGKHTSLRLVTIYGGVSQKPQVKTLQHGVDILVATPGRLLDLMEQGFVDLRHIQTFVLDEADRMLDMGFLPDIRRVITKLPDQRQTLMFSATMPDDIQKLADTILRDPVLVRLAPARATEELIDQSVFHVAQEQKSQLLVHLLSTLPMTRALVFTRTKHGADRLVRQLEKAGIKAEAIHSNKSQLVRQRTLANFKADRTQVLIATDIAARGIDVDGISHVFNFDLPQEPETYVHRIGRTGRAGMTGQAISFCGGGDRKCLKQIERQLRKTLPIGADHPVYTAQPKDKEDTPAAAKRDRQKRGHVSGASAPAGKPGPRPGERYRPAKKKATRYAATRQ